MDPADLASLADKLAALDLTGDERALLDGILARAALAEPEEVVGFTFDLLGGLSPTAEPIAAALGLLGDAPSGGSYHLEYGRKRER